MVLVLSSNANILRHIRLIISAYDFANSINMTCALNKLTFSPVILGGIFIEACQPKVYVL